MNQILIGHRGVSSMAPENTLAAFRMADQLGVPWVECDAEVLGDGTVVIFHDTTLDRCTGHTGKLADLTRADLQTIDAGSWFGRQFRGERIPTLDAFFSLVNTSRLCVNLEIKPCADNQLTRMLLDGVIQAIQQQWQKERPLIVSSFNHQILAEFKRRMPEVNVACLFEHYKLGSDWPDIMQQVKAAFIHPGNKGLKRSHIEAIKQRGYSINIWTVNDLKRAQQLFDWGVDGICTDIPQHFPDHYRQPQHW